jgi:hypothetical protein
MSYLGKVDMNDANIKHYSLTGSTLTVIPIGWVPASEQSLRVTINGVVQQGDTFSYSGSNLTLGGPLVATDTLEVVGIQSVGNIITPADNSVTTTKLADDAVTLAKMAGGTDGNLITYDASGDPAYVATGSATNILTSNGAGAAPTFQAAAVVGDNTPSFRASGGYSSAVSGTWYTMQLSSESWDTDGAFDTGTYRFTVPVGEGGKYVISYMVSANMSSAGQRVFGRVDKNGSDSDATMLAGSPGGSSQRVNAALTMILDLDAGDYIELKGQQNRGVDYDFRAGETWMTGFKLAGVA